MLSLKLQYIFVADKAYELDANGKRYGCRGCTLCPLTKLMMSNLSSETRKEADTLSLWFKVLFSALLLALSLAVAF